jgi:hypothetical protein
MEEQEEKSCIGKKKSEDAKKSSSGKNPDEKSAFIFPIGIVIKIIQTIIFIITALCTKSKL